MELEAGLKKNNENQKKLRELRTEFALHALKVGIDARDDGCVWLMREIAKFGTPISDSLLPDFIDSTTKQVIQNKFSYYQTAMDMREKNRFQIEFYKLMCGDQNLVDEAKRMITRGKKKEEPNPMLEFIGEMNSIAIGRRPQFSALTMGRPDSVTNYYENFSYVDQVSPNRLESAFGQSIVEDKALLTEATVPQQPIQEESSQPKLEALDDQKLDIHEALGHEPLALTLRPRGSLEQINENPNQKLSDRVIASAKRLEFRLFEKEDQVREANKFLRAAISANHRLQLASARSNFSFAESAIVKSKKVEFEQRGVVYIGDANYKFDGSKLYGVYTVPETIQIGKELISKAVRHHNMREVSKYTTSATVKSSYQSGRSALVSATLPSISMSTSQVHIKRVPSSMNAAIEAVGVEQEDPFDTHIKFYDGETLINSFSSREELFEQQASVSERNLCFLTLEIGQCELIIENIEAKEFNRVYDLYSVIQRNLASLESKGIRPTERMIRRRKETNVLIPHFEERPVGSYEVDLLIYLSTVMSRT